MLEWCDTAHIEKQKAEVKSFSGTQTAEQSVSVRGKQKMIIYDQNMPYNSYICSYMNKYGVNKLPSTVMKEVATRFRSLREAMEYTQAELAEQSGVAYITLRRFEKSGKISFESLLKLAYALNCLEQFDAIFKYDKPSNLDDLFSSKTKPS
ncbi:MAG: helix-turn-helix transcriptional regulator [Crocinitomicaceae bacterium]